MQNLKAVFVKWIPIAKTLTTEVVWIRNPRDTLCQRMPEISLQNKHKIRNLLDKHKNPNDSVAWIPKLLELSGAKQPHMESE